MGAPLRSVSSLTKWGPSVQFLRLIFSIFKKNVCVKLSLGGPHIFEFPGGGGVSAPPAGTYVHYPDSRWRPRCQGKSRDDVSGRIIVIHKNEIKNII